MLVFSSTWISSSFFFVCFCFCFLPLFFLFPVYLLLLLLFGLLQRFLFPQYFSVSACPCRKFVSLITLTGNYFSCYLLVISRKIDYLILFENRNKIVNLIWHWWFTFLYSSIYIFRSSAPSMCFFLYSFHPKAAYSPSYHKQQLLLSPQQIHPPQTTCIVKITSNHFFFHLLSAKQFVNYL